VLLEWIDPPFRTGHWGPDVVAAAGGVEMIGVAGTPAVAIEWDAVRAAKPEVLILACCGFDVARTTEDLPLLREMPGWGELPAVQRGEVWVMDGSAYVSRPGPRLADTAELRTVPAPRRVRRAGPAGRRAVADRQRQRSVARRIGSRRRERVAPQSPTELATADARTTIVARNGPGAARRVSPSSPAGTRCPSFFRRSLKRSAPEAVPEPAVHAGGSMRPDAFA
jgi:hypothetical protein